MHHEIVFAGFGGQGIMLVGQMVTFAGLDEGREVTWLPSYGPEMRGGTANCTVVISDRPIGSPIIARPQIAVVMNPPSYAKFGAALKPGGKLIVNSSLVHVDAEAEDIQAVGKRDDITRILVPANQLANEVGNRLGANMIILGALLAVQPDIVTVESIDRLIAWHFGEKKKKSQKVVDINKICLRKGIETGEAIMAELAAK